MNTRELSVICATVMMILSSCTNNNKEQVDYEEVEKQAKRERLRESLKYATIPQITLRSLNNAKLILSTNSIHIDTIIYEDDFALDAILEVIYNGEKIGYNAFKVLKGDSVTLIVGNGKDPYKNSK